MIFSHFFLHILLYRACQIGSIGIVCLVSSDHHLDHGKFKSKCCYNLTRFF
jgi:hypothetical protein